MGAAGKLFGKIGLKVISKTFFQYVVSDHARNGGTQFFGEGDILQKGKVQTFGLAPLQVSPLVAHPDLPIRKTPGKVLGLLAVMFLKRVSEYFLSKQQIYSM